MPIAGPTARSPWAAGAHNGAVFCSRIHRSHLRHLLQSPPRLRVPQDTQPPHASAAASQSNRVHQAPCRDNGSRSPPLRSPPRQNPPPHRSHDDALENMAQNVALTEPVLRERRVVGNRVIEIEPAKPPVCEVEFYFLAQLPLGANAEAVANDKHPDQQLGIDRRSADGAVEWTQLFVQVAEHRCHENIDPAQQVPLRDHVIEPKFVEKVRLLSILSSHHRRIILPSFNQQESSFSPSRKPFFDSIDPKRLFSAERLTFKAVFPNRGASFGPTVTAAQPGPELG